MYPKFEQKRRPEVVFEIYEYKNIVKMVFSGSQLFLFSETVLSVPNLNIDTSTFYVEIMNF